MCHKTQGLTLPCAVVHCSKEFVPGLIDVVVSQVHKAEDLQAPVVRKPIKITHD